jgi:class 3 adenylate cyclase
MGALSGVFSTGASKFSVTGDPINVASRVEGPTRVQRVDLLITGEVRATLDERFLLPPMPPACVKGKTQPIATWTVRGIAGNSETFGPAPRLQANSTAGSHEKRQV